MNYRADLVRLISQGASEADLIACLMQRHDRTEPEAYGLLETNGIEFGYHRRYEPKQDDISEERRRYLQQLSLQDC